MSLLINGLFLAGGVTLGVAGTKGYEARERVLANVMNMTPVVRGDETKRSERTEAAFDAQIARAKQTVVDLEAAKTTWSAKQGPLAPKTEKK